MVKSALPQWIFVPVVIVFEALDIMIISCPVNPSSNAVKFTPVVLVLKNVLPATVGVASAAVKVVGVGFINVKYFVALALVVAFNQP
jgi:hypothetical protein